MSMLASCLSRVNSMSNKRQQIAEAGSLLIGHYTTFLDTTFNSAFGDE